MKSKSFFFPSKDPKGHTGETPDFVGFDQFIIGLSGKVREKLGKARFILKAAPQMPRMSLNDKSLYFLVQQLLLLIFLKCFTIKMAKLQIC